MGTIGEEFAARSVVVDGKTVRAQFWDTAGQERYRSLTDLYYRNAAGAFVVYDISDRSSFESVEQWLHELRERADPDIAVMLVGNKCDLGHRDQRAVEMQEGAHLASRRGLSFMETSALDSTNVEDTFYMLLLDLIKH